MKKYLFASIFLLLTACFGGEEVSLDTLQASRSSLRTSAEYTRGGSGIFGGESAVALGARLSTSLSNAGAEQVIPDAIPTAQNRAREDTELIDALVTIVGTDMQQYLNQSTDRTTALREYINSLESHIQQSEVRLRSLSDKQGDLKDDVKRLERGVRDMRKELDDTILDSGGRGTELLLNDLTAKQTALSEAETDLLLTERIVETYEDILEPSTERLEAIRKNSSALIKGVKVVDLPGVEDLGVLEVGGRRGRR